MLVLELNLDEGVVLTEQGSGRQLAEIRIVALMQRPNQTLVRLGFEAPQDVRILRTELLDNGIRTRHGRKNKS